LDGTNVTASTDETVYVLDEGRVVRYDPSDGGADANGWVPLGRWNAVLDAPEGTVLREDVERRYSEMPSEWSPWEPGPQPAYDGSGPEIDLKAASSQEVIDEMWETLRLDYDDVSRSVLGQGSAGQDIYLYDFKPPAWEQKALVFCNIHGEEQHGIVSTYRMLREAYDRYHTDPQLAYARWKVWWRVVPIVNRAGLDAGTRQNANGVDLNNNFDYNWSQADAQPFGDSEVDTGANEFTLPGHGFGEDDPFRVDVGDSGAAPDPLTEGDTYYTVNVTTDTFQVADSQGGNPIDLTTAGSGERYIYDAQPGHFDYKGSAPFSEPEAQLIRDFVQNNLDAVTAFDIHSFVGASSSPKYFSVYPDDTLTQDMETAADVHGALAEPSELENEEVSTTFSGSPLAINWMQERGIFSHLPEWAPTSQGGSILDTVDVTAVTRYHGNLLLRSVFSSTPTTKDIKGPFIARFEDTSIDNTIPQTGSYIEISQYDKEFSVRQNGILVLSGNMIVGSDQTGQVFAIPKLGQDATNYLPGNSPDTPKQGWEMYTEIENDTGVIPLNATVPVVGADGKDHPVRVGLYAKSQISNVTIFRYDVLLRFTPTERGDRLQNFYFSDGQNQFLKL
jgi:hypothetical protein